MRSVIHEASTIAKALEQGWIAGAALDVFDDEPLPADHVLRSLPNTVLTPHVGYTTLDNYRDWFGLAVERIRSWQAGSPEAVLNP